MGWRRMSLLCSTLYGHRQCFTHDRGPVFEPFWASRLLQSRAVVGQANTTESCGFLQSLVTAVRLQTPIMILLVFRHLEKPAIR